MSDLDRNPEDRFAHIAAHMVLAVEWVIKHNNHSHLPWHYSKCPYFSVDAGSRLVAETQNEIYINDISLCGHF